MRGRRAALVAAALVLGACDTQKPSEPGLAPPQLISNSVSLPSDCSAGASAQGVPGEPSLAVDPTDATHLVAAWLDNRLPDRVGVAVANSRDAGQHWSLNALPHLLACDGGTYLHASDPWLAIGPDGVIYLASLTRRPATSSGTPHDIAVSVSRDHGATWASPVVVETATAPPAMPDKETILADRRHAGTAYAVWAEYQVTSSAEPSVDRIMFARTTDGGRSWSGSTTLYNGNDEAQENQLLMTAGGVLLDVFVEGASLPGTAQPPALPVKVRVMRSTDQGQTWSQPVDAATFTYTVGTDPANGHELRFGGQNIVATVAGNAVYVSWFENHRDFSTILIAPSDDAGKSWRAPVVVVRERVEAFLPQLAVAGDGTLGMMWFDFRHYRSGGPLNTDVWFSSSADRGAHWSTRHLAGPFDLRTAPPTRYGPFIGDYMGLVGLPGGFAAAFVQARPQARHGATDVFFSRILG